MLPQLGCKLLLILRVLMASIVVRQFERIYQKPVEALFRSGLEAYSGLRDLQTAYVDSQLRPGGDMHDIYSSYIDRDDGCSNFWVAVSGDEVVGCVGCLPYTGDAESLELQRLSVAESHRRSGLGRMLVETVEGWGIAKLKSRIVLSTLMEMNLARNFYIKSGYNEFAFEERDVSSSFSLPSNNKVLRIVHYQKLLPHTPV